MTNIDTVLLDLDGNITNSLPLWCRGCTNVLNQHKETLHRYPTDEEIIRVLIPALKNISEFGTLDPSFFIQSVVDYIFLHTHEVKLHRGMRRTLNELDKRVKKKALVTSSDRQTAVAILGAVSLSDYFSTIITRDDVTKTKPNPEPILRALEVLESNPNNSMMIGDSFVDIQGVK